ncbi:MAG: anion permease [Candidatus Euphemobacter frigidus]|nr:anion permease [Candidatus Euphemobacter frigidus]MDP8275257.1 anion permease [Candidatus Euphemobacter frigidus]
MIGKFLIANSGYKVLGGLYLGWGIGANNAANIFSTAVATNVLRFRTAVILIAVFVIIGSTIEGPGLFLSESTNFAKKTEAEAPAMKLDPATLALIATLTAALTITFITYLSIPTSTSQAAIGSFIGVTIASFGFNAVNWHKFFMMLVCWIFHPIIGLVLAVILLKGLGYIIERFIHNNITRDRLFKIGFLIFGCYGAYALGANNVVVTTSAYYNVGMFGEVGSRGAATLAATLGGISIALGALTYGKKVMITIGKKITPLSPFSALVVVIVHALTLHFCTQIGIPVSSSHAVVGALIGVGLMSGTAMINKKTLTKIFIGWVTTPIAAALLALIFAGVAERLLR